jgi:hypothetical protein
MTGPSILRLWLAVLLGTAMARGALAADPADWVGRYSFDRIDGRNFWEALGQRLDATVGAATANLLRRGWGPEVPVARDGPWIVAVACRRSSCNTNAITVALSSNSGRLIACTLMDPPKGPRDLGTWREAGKAPKPIVPLRECPREGFGKALEAAGLAAPMR